MRWTLLLAGGLALACAGCLRVPAGIEPVAGFELPRYLGRWYEIARLDHPFERGMDNVTAEYSLREDGSLRVLNRGYLRARGEWREAEGRARFVRDPGTGFLKVSFFGPFYGSYVIFDLDHEDYQWAFVAGPSRRYLWLLARSPEIGTAVRGHFLDRAAALGFPVDGLIFVAHGDLPADNPMEELTMIELPKPALDGPMSVERALHLRRSTRAYKNETLRLAELAQLLWAAQGITDEQGHRTAPSAGATYPLEVFVVANTVEGLAAGLYHYRPHEHRLELLRTGQLAGPLARASLDQSMLRDAAAVLVFAAVFERTTARYGARGERYVHNEIGHASQTVHLQAVALNLGTVVVGAFRDEEVAQALRLGDPHRVLYLMPVGRL